jgi:hypothetical protein
MSRKTDRFGISKNEMGTRGYCGKVSIEVTGGSGTAEECLAQNFRIAEHMRAKLEGLGYETKEPYGYSVVQVNFCVAVEEDSLPEFRVHYKEAKKTWRSALT